MIKCIHCGAEIEDDAKFCIYCGKPQDLPVKSKISYQKKEKDAYLKTGKDAEEIVQPKQEQLPHKRSYSLIYISAVLAVGSVLIAIFTQNLLFLGVNVITIILLYASWRIYFKN